MTKKRRLGELVVSELGLGCMGMSDFYGIPDRAEAIRTIHHALDCGVSFFDTADVYGPHTNEALVGEALTGRWRDVAVATKFGLRRGDDRSWQGMDGRPEYVRSACEGSLRRLQRDCIDLYYLHRVDPKVPIEETVGAMGDLVTEGKVRYLGLSEISATTLRRAHATHPIAAVQSEYSLWSREPEQQILPTLRALGVGFVAYSPLGRGFLTGALRSTEDLPATDYRRGSPRFQGENFACNRSLLHALEQGAATLGFSMAQLALAWVLHQGQDIVPIPGTKQRKYLAENIAAAAIELSAEQLARLTEAIPQGSVAGERYVAQRMSELNG